MTFFIRYKTSAKYSLEFMKQFIESHHQDHQQFILLKQTALPASAASSSAVPSTGIVTEWQVPVARPSSQQRLSNSCPTSSSSSSPAGAGSGAATAPANPSSGNDTVTPSDEELSVNLVLAKSVLFAGCFLGTPVFNVQGTTVTCVVSP